MKNDIVLIDAPAGKLEVEFILQDGERTQADSLALICHPNPAGGTMNNKVVSTMFRYCRDAGMDVARFNFRGVGNSTGVSEYGDGEFIDARTVLAWLTTQTQARQLWLGGFSFGGFVACRVADWLNAAKNASNDGGMQGLTLQHLALVAPSVERNDTSTLDITSPNTFMIYGDQDELVRPSVMADFAKARQIATTVMPDVGHFFHGKLTELKQALMAHTEKPL
ncbi:alpha/beta hydrolase [Moraxella caviae]|uniref:Alpha/beta hydrolase n=1 Tax=Moraxella caviae TaxID=34060 RepID=A0A1T0A2V6_9GAMM|nr:alpha/beta fold hydrolase [Moraxella caviae]OOR90037.1 alpha/beta hydrolase [Moraxella caviae]STZ14637.1 Predicted hydrolase of the alpha/beta-hydrolase fold [Moraxella caviae]VEW13343.1 Predicted hydrolase of the alpha/beta-hydrolase fold [Moraxella caviae]